MNRITGRSARTNNSDDPLQDVGMIKLGMILLMSMCLAATTACQTETAPQPNTPPTNHKPSYFGFAVVDCGFDDPTDLVEQTNYIAEVHTFSNVAQMCVRNSDEDISDRLSQFNTRGVKAILHVEDILFDHFEDPTTRSGIRTSLRIDASELWNQFTTLNHSSLNQENIAAVYVVDEPAWNGVTREEFTRTVQMVKTTLPNIPTMMIEASEKIPDILITNDVDWIGFDNYDTKDPKHDAVWLDQLKTVLNARTRSTQKLVVVASTQWLPYYEADEDVRPSDMSEIIESYYEVSKSQTDTIAMVGYLWPNALDDTAQIGARSLPDTVDVTLRTIGKEITGK